jgi:phosphoglycerate dehydrogenase-like enzyme
MAQRTVWVLARADDAGLPFLGPPPAGVTYVVREHPDGFAGQVPADAILVCSPGAREALRRVLDEAPNVRWVHSKWAGVDSLVYPELADRDLVVTNSRGVFSPALAEFVVAAMLFFAKDFRRLIRNQAARRWEQFPPAVLEGKILGVVGYGDIGRESARKASALGMRIQGIRRGRDPRPPDPLLDTAFPPERLPELLATSDFVLLATPLTAETRGLIGAGELAAMKPTGVLINVARGAVVDEEALIAALRQGAIGGAALDVFATEPLPADSPLWTLDNVLLSPHSADQTAGWMEQAMTCFRQNLDRFLRGEPLANVVDPRRGY